MNLKKYLKRIDLRHVSQIFIDGLAASIIILIISGFLIPLPEGGNTSILASVNPRNNLASAATGQTCSITCDRNRDNQINDADVNGISTCWMVNSSTSRWKECKSEDLNKDNIISMNDVLVFTKCCFSSPTPTPAPLCSTATYCQGKDLWGERWDALLGACMPYTVQANASQCSVAPTPSPKPETCTTKTYCWGSNLIGYRWDSLLGACMPYTVQANASQCTTLRCPIQASCVGTQMWGQCWDSLLGACMPCVVGICPKTSPTPAPGIN